MIVGIGTDIVEVSRIANLAEKHAQSFEKRILADAELIEIQSVKQPERFLAKRWAAKEAISKALGTGFTQGVSFTDMVIAHAPSGQPLVELSGKTLEVANGLGITRWHISISDEKHYALAYVMAESDDKS